MKIIKKTRKYLHVRMTEEEYDLLDDAIRQNEYKRQKEEERLAYAEWFFTNHVEICWEDEYSSWHTDWQEIQTKKNVHAPDFAIMTYKPRFNDIIRENKRKYGS